MAKSIRLIQSNIDEYEIPALLINKIYNMLNRIEKYNDEVLDISNSNIIGEIYVNGATYQEYIDKINQYFRHFKINPSTLYIMFADNNVKNILMNAGYGDGEGITIQQAKLISGSLPTSLFMNNTSITSFDELKYFGWSRGDWAYWSTGVFAGCTNLQSIDLTNFSEVSNIMFSGCYSLTQVKNFNGAIIGFSAFSGCSELTNINLSNVTSFGQFAFCNCNKLNVTEMGLDFTKITSIDFDGGHAFENCIGVGDVVFSSLNATKINHMFINCPSVTSITGNSSFTSISDYDSGWRGAISGCDSLRKIDFSMCTHVTSIKRHLCSNCQNLEIIKLPSTIEKIYNAPFGWNYLSSIKAIYFPVVTPPDVYEDSDLDGSPSGTFEFNKYASDLKIYVPDESITTYKSHSVWSGWDDRIVPLSQWTIDYPND